MTRFVLMALLVLSFTLDAKEGDLEKSFNKACTYFKAGEAKKAISLYKEAYSLVGSGIKKEIIAYNLGASYLEDGQFDEAIQKLESIFEKKENLPEYLIEKSSYNLMVAYIKKSEELLEKEEGELNKHDLLRAKEMLKKTSEMYGYFSKITDEKEGGQLKEDLWFKLKGLNSKYRAKSTRLELEEVTLELGIEKLKDHVTDQVFRFEKLAEKEISPSMSRYFLSKDYVSEKKSIPLWDRVDEIIEKKAEEIHSQDAEDKNAKEEEMLALSTGFQNSYNEYAASLDCMKENRLWSGRLKSAKAKLHLSLLDSYLKKEDLIEFCLNKRIVLQKKQSKTTRNSSFFNSLNKEIKLHSSAAYSFIDGGLKELDTQDDVSDKSLFISLGDVLKSNLKGGSNFYYDQSLYEEIKKRPEDILYPIYARLSDPLKMNPQVKEKALYQLKAATKRFDLQNKLDYEGEKKKKIAHAYDKVSVAYHAYCAENYPESRQNLEDFLLNWNFRPFMAGKMGDFRQKYNALLKDKVEEGAFQELTQDLTHLENLQKKAEGLSAEEELKEYLSKGFEEVKSSMAAYQNIKGKPLKELLIENGQMWTKRMLRKLNLGKKNSMEILKEGIEEQKHSLNFSKAYPKEGEIPPSVDEKLRAMAVGSEDFPIDAVEAFESTFYKEQANQEKEEKEQNSIDCFQKGLEEACAAKKLLEKEAVSWDQVIKKQKKVIELWEKALDKPKEEGKGSSQKGASNEEQNSEGENQSENISQASESELKEEGASHKDSQKIMGVLERLQEMQQDDKIVKKKDKNPKKGLRPW